MRGRSSQDLAVHIGWQGGEWLRDLDGGDAGQQELVLARQIVLGRDNDTAALVQQLHTHGLAQGTRRLRWHCPSCSGQWLLEEAGLKGRHGKA